MSDHLRKALEHLREFEKERFEPTPDEYELLTEIETLAFYLWRAPNDAQRDESDRRAA